MTKTVLITEDERILRVMMAEAMEEQGLNVLQAENGAEAIKIMETQKPDLLLVDLLMPKVDGYGVLQYVRDKKYKFPIVVLSNLSDPTEEKRCLKLGAKEFIIKSDLDEGDLWGRVKKYLK
jgi:DNA-binding response OmpR family regulator